MKIKLFILVLTMIIIATSVYSAKIATLYSDFMDRGYKNTLVSELTEAGFEVVPYENIYFKDLISNINDYEMLICVPTFNYSNSVQIENYKNELTKYVEEGGIIIVSDANYPQQYEWIGKVFKGLDFSSGAGGGDELQSPNVYAKDHPLLKDIKLPTLPWCDVIGVSRQYDILLTDKKNRPVLVYKEIGKGILVVSSMYYPQYGFPNVDFIKNLISYKNDEKRKEQMLFKPVEINKNPLVKVSNKTVPPKTYHMDPVQGNTFVNTDWTVTYDSEGMYFDIICYDEDIINASSSTVFRDGPVWHDDSIEIFIKPPWSDDRADYYHYIISIDNVQSDEVIQDAGVDTYFESKTEVEKDRWTASVFIPFASMGINANTYLRHTDEPDTSAVSVPLHPKFDFDFNICRSYHPGKNNAGLYSFAYMDKPAFHSTEYWGRLRTDPIDFDNFVITRPVKIVCPEILSVGLNEFKVDVPFLEGISAKIIDYTNGKVYDTKDGICEINFTDSGEHLLMAVIYNKVNDRDIVIASSNTYKVEVADVLDVTTLYPYYRNIVQSKDPDKTFTLKVKIGNTDAKDLQLKWTIKTDKPIVSKTVSVKANDIKDIIYDLSKFNPGEYVYEIVLTSKGEELRRIERGFRVLEPSDMEVTFDKKRICYVNGEPFFPIILYHSGELMMNYLNENKKEDTPALEIKSMLKDIADHGFNGVITQAPFPMPKEYVDNTHNAGMKITYELGATTNPETLEIARDTYNKYNAGLFYYTVDEPIGERLKTAIEEYNSLSFIDPHRPVGAAVCHASVFKEANNAFDIMMPDNYIIRHNREEGRPSFRGLLSFITAAMEPNQWRKPLWPVPQAFGWGGDEPGFGIPTREELRCQMYFYLVYGATGFAWYGYTSPERDEIAPYNLWHLPSSDLWEYFITLNSEMKDFSQIIIKGDSVGPLKGDNDMVHSNVWKMGKKNYAIIVNPEREEQQVNYEIKGKIKPYFKDYTYNFEQEGNQAWFLLKPLECVIIEF